MKHFFTMSQVMFQPGLPLHNITQTLPHDLILNPHKVMNGHWRTRPNCHHPSGRCRTHSGMSHTLMGNISIAHLYHYCRCVFL